jgi:hypothetical protein
MIYFNDLERNLTEAGTHFHITWNEIQKKETMNVVCILCNFSVPIGHLTAETDKQMWQDLKAHSESHKVSQAKEGAL